MVDQDTDVTLTAAAASPGDHFLGWQGCDSTTASTCTVKMTAAKTVIATFRKKFTLSVATTGEGTVTSSGSTLLATAGVSCPGTCTTSYLDGEQITLTGEAASGFEIATWTNGCANGLFQCTVTMTTDRSVTAEFRQLGLLSWFKRLGGSPTFAFEFLTDVAIDDNGDVLVVGQVNAGDTIDFGAPVGVQPQTTVNSVLVARYSSSGTPIWGRLIAGTGNASGSSIAVAPDGDVVIAGNFVSFFDLGGGHTITGDATLSALVAKLDGATGAGKWVTGFGSTGTDMAASIDVTLDGTVLVLASSNAGSYTLAGTTIGPITNGDTFDVIAAYDTNGVPLWARDVLHRPVGGADKIFTREIVATPGGDALIAGTYIGAGNLQFGTLRTGPFLTAYLAVFDGVNGTHEFSKAYGGSAVDDTVAIDVLVTAVSRVDTDRIVLGGIFTPRFATPVSVDLTGVAGGETLTCQGISDMFFATYLVTDGSYVDSFRAGGAATSGDERPADVAIGATTDDFSITGTFDTATTAFGQISLTSAGNRDMFIAKTTSAGAEIYARRFGGNETEAGSAIAVSSTGQATAVGTYNSTVAFTFDGQTFPGNGTETEAVILTLAP